MSRGPGKIQRAILSVIVGDEDGAHSTTDLCEQVYRGVNRIEKKHRVAVTRALRTMLLPETWNIAWAELRDADQVLYNRLSLESTSRKRWLTLFGRRHCSYERFRTAYPHQIDNARNELDEYRKYFDADPVGRLDILIADEQKRVSVAMAYGAGTPEFFKAVAERVEELQRRKAELAPSINVSQTSRLPSENTYREASA